MHKAASEVSGRGLTGPCRMRGSRGRALKQAAFSSPSSCLKVLLVAQEAGDCRRLALGPSGAGLALHANAAALSAADKSSLYEINEDEVSYLNGRASNLGMAANSSSSICSRGLNRGGRARAPVAKLGACIRPLLQSQLHQQGPFPT